MEKDGDITSLLSWLLFSSVANHSNYSRHDQQDKESDTRTSWNDVTFTNAG